MHITSLRGSLTSLTHIKVSASSAGQLTGDLTNINRQLDALKGQHLGEFSSSATELRTSMNQIQKSASQLSTNPTTATKNLSTQLTHLKSRATPIIAQMKTVCPSS